MKVEVHKNLIFVTISQSNTIDIQILNFLVNLLSVEVDEWIRRLPAMQGDCWFNPRPCTFEKKVDFFMIFEVYLRSIIEPRRERY